MCTYSDPNGATWQVPDCDAQVTIFSITPLFSARLAKQPLPIHVPLDTDSTSYATQVVGECSVSANTQRVIRTGHIKRELPHPVDPTYISIQSSE